MHNHLRSHQVLEGHDTAPVKQLKTSDSVIVTDLFEKGGERENSDGQSNPMSNRSIQGSQVSEHSDAESAPYEGIVNQPRHCEVRRNVVAREVAREAEEAVTSVIDNASWDVARAWAQDSLTRWISDLGAYSQSTWEQASAAGREAMGRLLEHADETGRWAEEQIEAGYSRAMIHASIGRERAKARMLDISAPLRGTMLGNLKELIKDSTLADPDMWQCMRTCTAATLDRVLADIERELEYSLEAALLKQESDRIAVGPKGSWPMSWYYAIRAFLLHHYLPHDRSIYGKLKDPAYVAIMILTLLPVYIVRVAFFSMILMMIVFPCPPDEFQLVNFILLCKGSQFLNAGLLMMAKGAMQYFICFTQYKDNLLLCLNTQGPGAKENLLPSLVDYLGSCVLVWIAFKALPYSKSYVTRTYVGRRFSEDDQGQTQTETEEDSDCEKERSCGCFSYKVTKRGGRLGQLLRYDVKSFLFSLLALGVLAVWTISLDGEDNSNVINWLLHSPQFKENFFWCKVLYGLLSLPFFPFMIPLFLQVLTHCEYTGYNEQGACVAYELPVTGKRRSSFAMPQRMKEVLVRAASKYGRSRLQIARSHSTPYAVM